MDVLNSDFRCKWPSKNNFSELDISQSLVWQCPSLSPYFLLALLSTLCFGTDGLMLWINLATRIYESSRSFSKLQKHSVQPVHSVHSVLSVQLVHSVHSARSLHSVNFVQPLHSVQPVHSVHLVHSVRSVRSVQPVLLYVCLASVFLYKPNESKQPKM